MTTPRPAPFRSAGCGGPAAALALLLALAAGPAAAATAPWPAEPHTNAVKLTTVDTEFNAVNMSGAAWNPVTRTLWLANNSGFFWALVENGSGGFRVATNSAGTRAKWAAGGDLESICQADFASSTVYLMDEDGWIREYDASQYGVVRLIRSWDIRAQCPEVSGSGPEGLAFVPDDWLRREGFRSAGGGLYASTNGMGGLMFVGHQSGGYVHAFDLSRSNNAYGYVGRFKTGQSETAGLEFDRSTGKLYVWHNTGINYLEVTELGSTIDGSERRLRQIAEYAAPRTGNLEGFAMAPTPETNDWCFVADDNNDYGEAITWYRQFRPSEDADGDSLPDGWELWHFGTITQTVGTADTDSDGVSNAGEAIAGTDPTNRASALVVSARAGVGPGSSLVLSWPSATGRTYSVRRAASPSAGFTAVESSGVQPTPPLNVSTVAAPPGATSSLYRVSAELHWP